MGTTDKVVRILLTVAIAGLYFTNQISETVVTELFVLAGVFCPYRSVEFKPLKLLFGISILKKVK